MNYGTGVAWRARTGGRKCKGGEGENLREVGKKVASEQQRARRRGKRNPGRGPSKRELCEWGTDLTLIGEIKTRHRMKSICLGAMSMEIGGKNIILRMLKLGGGSRGKVKL